MYLKNISLVSFKNYKEAELKLSSKINCFVGNNGSGKTNLLEAIHYLSMCKSFLGTTDAMNVNFEHPFFVLQGNYELNNNEEKIHIGYKKNQKKTISRNGKEYKTLSEHIGLLPLTLVSPADIELITGSGDERRRFLDSVISQFNREYLHALIRYQKALLQRNNLLKIFDEKKYFDNSQLEIWDEQLILNGEIIYKTRQEFITNLQPVFNDFYNYIANNNEEVTILYQSQLQNTNFRNLIQQHLDKDRYILHTTAGIHRDDLLLHLNNLAIKKIGSQGQQKTFLLALKFAQFEFMTRICKFKPMLLLDDIFDKLDENRVLQILNLVNSDRFGQIFITDTSKERLSKLFNQMQPDLSFFVIKNGEVA